MGARLAQEASGQSAAADRKVGRVCERASIWEISIKAALGKLAANLSEVLVVVEPAGFALLPISGEHAADVAKLALHHKDPFDRVLVAQARCEPTRPLSNDEILRAYGDFVIIV